MRINNAYDFAYKEELRTAGGSAQVPGARISDTFRHVPMGHALCPAANGDRRRRAPTPSDEVEMVGTALAGWNKS